MARYESPDPLVRHTLGASRGPMTDQERFQDALARFTQEWWAKRSAEKAEIAKIHSSLHPRWPITEQTAEFWRKIARLSGQTEES